MFLEVWFRSHLLFFICFCSELEKFLVGHRFLGQITNFNSSTRSGFIKSAQVFKGRLTRDFQLSFFQESVFPGSMCISLGRLRKFSVINIHSRISLRIFEKFEAIRLLISTGWSTFSTIRHLSWIRPIVCQVGVKELRFQYQSVQSSTKMGSNLKGGRVFFHLTHTPPHTIKVSYWSCGSGFASYVVLFISNYAPYTVYFIWKAYQCVKCLLQS